MTIEERAVELNRSLLMRDGSPVAKIAAAIRDAVAEEQASLEAAKAEIKGLKRLNHDDRARLEKAYEDRIREIRAEATAWRPIDETAPRDGTQILAWYGGGDYAVVLEWSDRANKWVMPCSMPGIDWCDAELVGWQPLPSPPRKDGE